MRRSDEQLREDALAIWRAGVDAVASERLVQNNVQVQDSRLVVVDQSYDLPRLGRLVVVGAGKAGAGMAAGLEAALGPSWMAAKQLRGWVNVPEDCVRPLTHITLHGARPAGLNEPTPAGVLGAERILQLVQALGPDDLCICLLSGGGSALLPAPVAGVSLADKQALTQHLSAAGANIQQLNTVRKQISRIKGGRLAEACRAGSLITLIISDVIGDPLDVIASGPTVPDPGTPQDALRVLDQFHARDVAPAAVAYLESAAAARPAQSSLRRARNYVIGNNALAVDAAGIQAQRRGYRCAMHAASTLEGQAEEVGRHLADMALQMQQQTGPDCLITGGEPTVTLAEPSLRGKGGRNQQLVLAALRHLLQGQLPAPHFPTGILLLAGGTDGEDGPTDAAGAWVDARVAAEMHRLGLDPDDYLRRNDAYHFFHTLHALIKTGPTHTNVCDVRVVVVNRIDAQHAAKQP